MQIKSLTIVIFLISFGIQISISLNRRPISQRKQFKASNTVNYEIINEFERPKKYFT